MEFLNYGSANVSEGRGRRSWLFFAAACLIGLGVLFVVAPIMDSGGGAVLHVSIHVIDARTGKPIPNACIQLRPPNRPARQVFADTMGDVKADAPVRGGQGYKPLFYTRTYYNSGSITISASGYIPEDVFPPHGSTLKVFGIGPEPTFNSEVALRPQSIE